MKAHVGNPESGSVLVGVLIIATIVIMLGLGRLNDFRHKVALRADRAARLREVSATQSAIAWLERCAASSSSLPLGTNEFVFVDSAGVRQDGWPNDFSVRPADWIFPAGAEDIENLLGASVVARDEGGIEHRVIECGNASSQVGDVVKWPGVDVASEGHEGLLWTDSVYGARYAALFAGIFTPAAGVGDVIRFALTPHGREFSVKAKSGEAAPPALWLEQMPTERGVSVSVMIRDGNTFAKCLTCANLDPSTTKGLQIAGTRVALIEGLPTIEGPRGFYDFRELAAGTLSPNSVSNFVDACKSSGGLRFSIEAEIKADRSKYKTALPCNRFWGVSAMPSYEYEILVKGKDAEGFAISTYVDVDSTSSPVKLKAYDAFGLTNQE